MMGGLFLALLSAKAHSEGTLKEQFDRAEKVFLGSVLYLSDEYEEAEFSSHAKPWRNQTLWIQDKTVFKGPKQSETRGYQVVYAPIRVNFRSPLKVFRHRLTSTDVPPDAEILFYLEKDPSGAWRLMDGRDGMYRYPGVTRIKQLNEWSQKEPKIQEEF